MTLGNNEKNASHTTRGLLTRTASVASFRSITNGSSRKRKSVLKPANSTTDIPAQGQEALRGSTSPVHFANEVQYDILDSVSVGSSGSFKSNATSTRWQRFKQRVKQRVKAPLDYLYDDLHTTQDQQKKDQWKLRSIPNKIAALINEVSTALQNDETYKTERAQQANGFNEEQFLIEFLTTHQQRLINANTITQQKYNDYVQRYQRLSRQRADLPGEISAKQEEIREHEERIKKYKANRRWYDISKWSTNEKIARMWFVLLYATLVAIAINASINALQIPLSFKIIGLTLPVSAFLGVICAAIAFSVNASGFWDNVAKLFDEGDRSELKGKYSVLYKFFTTVFIGVTATLATGLSLSTIPGVFGIGASNYSILFPIFLMFGTTAYAMQGLYTQQPRKWFKSFYEHGFEESLIRTAYKLWFGFLDDQTHPFINEPRTDWVIPQSTPGTIAHGIARVFLFLTFAGITTYASWMMAPYASKVTTDILVNMLSFITKGGIHNIGITGLGFVPGLLSVLFVAGSICYNGALSGKLSIIATPFFEKLGKASFESFMKPINWIFGSSAAINAYTHRKVILSVMTVVPLVLAVGNIFVSLLSYLYQKEVSCWAEARDYARKQYYQKDSDYIWPHFIARLLYNHLPIWGAANAVSNGALTAYSKFGGKNVDLDELSNRELIDASTSVVAGTTRSYGFFWLTKGDRDKAMQESENAIELAEIEAKKLECAESYWWSKPDVHGDDDHKEINALTYDEYFDNVSAGIRTNV